MYIYSIYTEHILYIYRKVQSLMIIGYGWLCLRFSKNGFSKLGRNCLIINCIPIPNLNDWATVVFRVYNCFDNVWHCDLVPRGVLPTAPVRQWVAQLVLLCQRVFNTLIIIRFLLSHISTRVLRGWKKIKKNGSRGPNLVILKLNLNSSMLARASWYCYILS